jgi:hypothetical protein
MRAHKNSSPKNRTRLYPKYTTKDSHTSLPRSRSHNGPTNPRNKPQHTPERKHNSRGEGLGKICQLGTDRPCKDLEPSVSYGGPSVKRGQTVREARTVCLYYADITSSSTPANTDRPIRPHEPPVSPTDRPAHSHRPSATVSQKHTLRACLTNRPSRLHGLSVNLVQQKPKPLTDRSSRDQEHDEHTMNTMTHGPSVGLGRTIRPTREQRTMQPRTRGSTLPRHPWISQTAAWIETRFWGAVKSSLGDAIPKNLEP